MPCSYCGNRNRPVNGRCGFCGRDLDGAEAPLLRPGAPALKGDWEKLAPPPGMVRVPAGEFWMGSPDGEGAEDERPRHRVYLDAFFIAKYPVTAGEYRAWCLAVGAALPEQPAWSTDAHPVVGVDWDEAAAYCAWTGGRLPTEAEWEKAARAGADTTYHFGDGEETRGVFGFGRRDLLGDYAWRLNNSSGVLHPVGGKLPNAWGLYDMPGEIWEWTVDWYGADYYARSPLKNPGGAEAGEARALRGGQWDYEHLDLRPAGRSGQYPGNRYGLSTIGFRLAASPGAALRLPGAI
jgi:formylglycine-generating enzyme